LALHARGDFIRLMRAGWEAKKNSPRKRDKK
jgi:hypothetical protein